MGQRTVPCPTKLNFKFSRAYGKKGPVLSYISAEPCEAPAQDVATFY